MAQRDRAWRRRKARNVIAKVKERLFRTSENQADARPHRAQKARCWWSTEQQLREV